MAVFQKAALVMKAHILLLWWFGCTGMVLASNCTDSFGLCHTKKIVCDSKKVLTNFSTYDKMVLRR